MNWRPQTIEPNDTYRTLLAFWHVMHRRLSLTDLRCVAIPSRLGFEIEGTVNPRTGNSWHSCAEAFALWTALRTG